MLRRTLAVLVSGVMLVGCSSSTDSDVLEQFTASANGAAERPTPRNVPGTATGTFTLNKAGTVLSVDVSIANVQNITASHIHGPATTEQPAGIVANLFLPSAPVTTTGFTATVSAASGLNGISMDSLLKLMRTGQTYLNIHTSANLSGEIRGQITRK